MSQDSVLKLLKKHSKGLTAKQMIEKFGFSRTVYVSLRKLRDNCEVSIEVIKEDGRWTTLYKLRL